MIIISASNEPGKRLRIHEWETSPTRGGREEEAAAGGKELTSSRTTSAMTLSDACSRKTKK